LFAQNLEAIYLCGFTGTGKSVIIQTVLKKLAENHKNPTSSSSVAYLSGGHKKNHYQYLITQINFSAQTSSGAIQGLIENKLQTQRKNGRNILMPPPGKKLTVFIDDINMP
jgi:dynein heavy chain